jgi:hypothetical protein
MSYHDSRRLHIVVMFLFCDSVETDGDLIFV